MRSLGSVRLQRREFPGLGAGAGLALAAGLLPRALSADDGEASLLLTGGRIATLDPARPFVEALAARDGRVLATGTTQELMRRRGARTQLIDLRGRTAIPGLDDSHLHVIRGTCASALARAQPGAACARW